MSDYISREQVVDVLKETGIIQDNDLGHLVVDEINRIPTLDEKEIIRKPFERVVECLNEKLINADLECASWKNKSSALFRCADSKRIAYAEAIEIVKEECGINE